MPLSIQRCVVFVGLTLLFAVPSTRAQETDSWESNRKSNSKLVQELLYGRQGQENDSEQPTPEPDTTPEPDKIVLEETSGSANTSRTSPPTAKKPASGKVRKSSINPLRLARAIKTRNERVARINAARQAGYYPSRPTVGAIPGMSWNFPPRPVMIIVRDRDHYRRWRP